MNKKNLFVSLIVVYTASFLVAGELPFEKGDTIGLVPLRSDQATIKNAKVIDINGRWIFVEAKGGGTQWSGWYNIDNIQEVWVVQKVKEDTKK